MDILDDEAVLGREALGDQLSRFDFVSGDDVLNSNICPEVIEIGMALVLFDQGANLLVVDGHLVNLASVIRQMKHFPGLSG